MPATCSRFWASAVNRRPTGSVLPPAPHRRRQDPAYRPDPEPAAVRVDVLDLQRRVGSSLAEKKSDAVVRISFALRSSAFSARRHLSSATAASASASREESSPAARSALFRHRRSVSGAMPQNRRHRGHRPRLRRTIRPRPLQKPQRLLPELLRITHTLSHDPIISYQTRGKDGTKTRSHQNQATSSLDTERISLSVRESPIRGIYLIMSPIYTLFGLPNRPRSLETLHPFAAFNIIDFNLIMGSRII